LSFVKYAKIFAFYQKEVKKAYLESMDRYLMQSTLVTICGMGTLKMGDMKLRDRENAAHSQGSKCGNVTKAEYGKSRRGKYIGPCNRPAVNLSDHN